MIYVRLNSERTKTLLLHHQLKIDEWRGKICTNEIQEVLKECDLFKMQ